MSGGSEAVETAIKAARQAQMARGFKDKYKIISHHDSYHGMTLATLGVSGSPGTHKPYVPMIPKWPHIRQYSDFDKARSLKPRGVGCRVCQSTETAIHYEGEQTVAAFIATPWRRTGLRCRAAHELLADDSGNLRSIQCLAHCR